MAKDSKKPVSKPAKPAAKPAAKPSKPAAKPAAKPAVKAPSKPAAKVTKPAAKPAAKPVAKGTAKPAAKVEVKKVAGKEAAKPVAKPVTKPVAKVTAKPAAAPAKAPAPAKLEAKPETGPGSGRKGITVVDNKPVKKPKPIKPSAVDELASLAGELLRPGGPAPKPLISSGAKAPSTRPLGSQLEYAEKEVQHAASPFNKTDLKHFRDILLTKRGEILADVSSMEKQALEGGSGALSHQPQHIAEQGSDTYDQTLALSIAEADRKTIREIDDALARIDNGTYGVCEASGKLIPKTRLEELPWARLTIEAARAAERRTVHVSRQPPPSYYS